MRSLGWLLAIALLISGPAAALEPDVTGSIPQASPLADAEVVGCPRFPSIAPELLEMLSERVLPTAIGPYTLALLWHSRSKELIYQGFSSGAGFS